MSLLQIVWMTSITLLVISIGGWFFLIGMNVINGRRLKRRQIYQDEWLDRLMDWMEPDGEVADLPKAKNAEEMEAVLMHIRDLAENFRGKYRERLAKALELVGALDYALDLLDSRSASHRANGVAILSWCSLTQKAYRQLWFALDDPSPMVRLEAANALGSKNRLTDPEHVLECLCRDEAGQSLVARDLFRRWGVSSDVDWARLLKKEWSDDATILLLEAAGGAAKPELTNMIAEKISADCSEVVITALKALEEFADPQAVVEVYKASENPSPQVRRQVVKTIMACGDLDGSSEVLLRLSMDENFEVRRAAINSLIEMGGSSILPRVVAGDYWQEQFYLEAGLVPGKAS